MTVGDAVEIHKQRVAGDASSKSLTKECDGQRLVVWLKSWPGSKEKLIRDGCRTRLLSSFNFSSFSLEYIYTLDNSARMRNFLEQRQVIFQKMAQIDQMEFGSLKAEYRPGIDPDHPLGPYYK
jgi:hypothetical protein